MHPSPAPGSEPLSGIYARESLTRVTAEVNRLAQRLFDPVGREVTFVILAPEVAADGMQYRASVSVRSAGPPLERVGDTALGAVLALFYAVESVATTSAAHTVAPRALR